MLGVTESKTMRLQNYNRAWKNETLKKKQREKKYLHLQKDNLEAPVAAESRLGGI